MSVGLYAGAVASILFASAWALSALAVSRFEHALNIISATTIQELESVGNMALVGLVLLVGASISLSIFGVAIYRASRSGIWSVRTLGFVVALCAIAYALLQVAGGAIYTIGMRKLYEAIATTDFSSIAELWAQYPSAGKSVATGVALEGAAFVALFIFVLALSAFVFVRPRVGKALSVVCWIIIALVVASFFWNPLPLAIVLNVMLAALLVWLFLVSVFLARPITTGRVSTVI